MLDKEFHIKYFKITFVSIIFKNILLLIINIINKMLIINVINTMLIININVKW